VSNYVYTVLAPVNYENQLLSLKFGVVSKKQIFYGFFPVRIVKDMKMGLKMKNKEIIVGDYVFASRWPDGDPNDPWYVGFVDEINEKEGFSTLYKVGGRNYRYCRKISKKQGEKILEKYPKLELGRKI